MNVQMQLLSFIALSESELPANNGYFIAIIPQQRGDPYIGCMQLVDKEKRVQLFFKSWKMVVLEKAKTPSSGPGHLSLFSDCVMNTCTLGLDGSKISDESHLESIDGGRLEAALIVYEIVQAILSEKIPETLVRNPDYGFYRAHITPEFMTCLEEQLEMPSATLVNKLLSLPI